MCTRIPYFLGLKDKENMVLTEAQKDVKIAYLEQENSRLRSALLDYQIVAGEISLASTNEGEN